MPEPLSRLVAADLGDLAFRQSRPLEEPADRRVPKVKEIRKPETIR